MFCDSQLAEESFPLCMKHLYDVLKTQHHLKHFSRVQLNLFFKGIGLSLEDSLQLFRTEFVKGKTEPEKVMLVLILEHLHDIFWKQWLDLKIMTPFVRLLFPFPTVYDYSPVRQEVRVLFPARLRQRGETSRLQAVQLHQDHPADARCSRNARMPLCSLWRHGSAIEAEGDEDHWRRW